MDELNKQVRRAQWWLGVGRFVRALGWCCFATLFLAAVLIAVDKFRPTGVEAWIWAAGGLALGLVAAALWAVVSGRGPVDAAIEIDHRFDLKERVSSALAMSDEQRQTGVGRALAEDAVRRVSRIDVGDRFAASPGRQIFLPLVPAVIAVLIVLLVRPAAVDGPDTASAAESVNKQVRKTVDSLRDKLIEKRKRAQAQGLGEARELFERLEQDTDGLAKFNEGDRKKALVKLNDLGRQLQQRRDRLGGAENIQKQFNRLKNVGRGPADKLLDELRRGNFRNALEQIERLKKQVAAGNLSEQQRKDLARQLDQVKKKLQDLVDAHREAEKDLERRVEQARQEGRDDEANKLQEQLNKLRQQLPQMNQLADVAEKLGQCSQSLQDGKLADAEAAFSDLQTELSDLQNQLQELDMLDDAMDQLAQCRNQMNCALCGGAGCEACEGEGLGAGRGRGPRPEEESPVGFRDTATPQKIGPGVASVVGEVDGPNIKGDIRQKLKEQYQSARLEAADPLTGQRLPRKHREHAKEYFDRFREGK